MDPFVLETPYVWGISIRLKSFIHHCDKGYMAVYMLRMILPHQQSVPQQSK